MQTARKPWCFVLCDGANNGLRWDGFSDLPASLPSTSLQGCVWCWASFALDRVQRLWVRHGDFGAKRTNHNELQEQGLISCSSGSPAETWAPVHF
jgi:hypothetical protein